MDKRAKIIQVVVLGLFLVLVGFIMGMSFERGNRAGLARVDARLGTKGNLTPEITTEPFQGDTTEYTGPVVFDQAVVFDSSVVFRGDVVFANPGAEVVYARQAVCAYD